MKTFYVLFLALFVANAASSQSTALASDGGTAARILKFYPNPAVSVINFDFQKDYDKAFSFQIYSFVGKKVFELNNVTPKTTVNLGDFYRGIYIFQLRDRNGRVVDSGKFQVSK